MMFLRFGFIFIFCWLSFLPGSVLAAPRELHSEFKIPLSGVLRERALFWVQIYSKLTTTQGLLHDARYPSVIYEEMDFEKPKRNRPAAVRAAKDHYKKILLSLHESGVEENPQRMEKLSSEEKKIYDLFLNIHEPNKFLAAAHYKRIRFQLGQRDRFLQGFKDSGRYLPFMEEIFIKNGLPFELTRLPFVESSFNTRAVSKVGASGIWQFMPSSARDFIQIGPAVDERNDPLRATEAASGLLKLNYQSLNRWSLAVTAYNHGRTSLMKAVRKLGTDSLEDLIVLNKAKTFGFASSNFFACLLAAIEVERNAEKYFGPLDRERPHLFYEVQLPQSIFLKDLVSFMKLKRSELLDLNPGMTPEGVQSRVRLPQGYRLRLPTHGAGTRADSARQQRVFLAGFAKIPRAYKTK
jgi:membrane-bound lytic murein transglycosylase D